MISMKNGRFIYVFDIQARDKLLQAGFTMLVKDELNSVFVFSRESVNTSFSLSDIDHILSDTLTF